MRREIGQPSDSKGVSALQATIVISKAVTYVSNAKLPTTTWAERTWHLIIQA